MKRVILAVVLLTGVSCLRTVDDRWCGPQLPCSPGFFCTSNFHCVRSSAVDAGTGGGSAGGGSGGGGGALGGGSGGGFGGGGGGVTGGGGGGGTTSCNRLNCNGGCCLGDRCMGTMQQGHEVCGFFGAACARCGLNESCTGGKCEPGIDVDGGTTGTVGNPCVDDFDCGNDGLNFCIPEQSGGQPTGFPGGYCSRTCDGNPCPSNAACVEAQTTGGGVVNICLLACQSMAQCRMGYLCDQQGGQGVCFP